MADHPLDGLSGYPRGLSGAALSPRRAGHHIEHIKEPAGARTSWPDPDVMASGGDPDQDGHRTRLPGASALSFPTSRQLTSA